MECKGVVIILISKEVEVKVVGITLKHYRQFYPDIMCGDNIVVQISELPKGSGQNIDVQCDTCGNVYQFRFLDYTKHRNDYENSIYECRKCEIDRVWRNLVQMCEKLGITLLSDKSIYKTHKTVVDYVCNKHSVLGVQSCNVNSILAKQYRCKSCAHDNLSKAKRMDFNEVKGEFDKKGYVLLEEHYKNAKQKLEYICPAHPEKTRYITYDKLSRGQGCFECGNEKMSELQRVDINIVRELFKDKGLIYDYENIYTNNLTPLRYVCSKHIEKGEQTITFASLSRSVFGCNYCAVEYRSELMSKGGLTPIHNFLRGEISQWNRDSMVECEYRCVLTGGRFDTIHHLYGFNLILKEVFQKSNLPIYDNVGEYSKCELSQLIDLCIELHSKHGFGVCLNRDIHDLFHIQYGKGNNTPEQFQEFKARLVQGEFDDFLSENNLTLVAQ